ncbi:MAG TPA: 1-deoxy-D-xylulose-5-phosphate reductoisomerase [Xanthobacteraceae bacterium]|nr:1-deoxy-D-xylulose-5-phosphate reductoisomerase [Xanthobacteraceae bacterium]
MSAIKTASRKTAVSILGATGSIGKSALDIVRRAPERYEIAALTAHRDGRKLAALAREYGAKLAVVAEPEAYGELCDSLSGSGIRTAAGREGLLLAAAENADVVIAAISGAAGLEPTLAALLAKRRIALANKECLVSAGRLFMQAAKASGAIVLPLDSEHNAIFQALTAGPPEAVERVTLTASGGPFRTFSSERLARVVPEEALRHPIWSMGAKITIDSATLMNKGLELIEAHHLFGLSPDRLDVLVHPQSIVHALVAYRDGAVVAGLSVPDMRVPVAYCLGWPERPAWEAPRLDLAALATLSFEPPDPVRFPALRLARAAMEAGGPLPTVLNAANEVAVGAFLARRIGFLGIAAMVESVLEQAASKGLREPATVEEALAVDHIGRSLAHTLLPQFAAKAS